MKVAVCDDNREFCEKERTTIKDVFKQYFQGEDCQVDIYNDGQTIINNYPGNAYDMVFLDLELGDENGFDIAEQIVLMNNDAIIIFVTSHENLVYEAFRFRPLGYIVKDRFDREFTRMMVKIVDKDETGYRTGWREILCRQGCFNCNTEKKDMCQKS